jgi:hypothetical protein
MRHFQTIRSNWSRWLLSILSTEDEIIFNPTFNQIVQPEEYEYGIGLDYSGSLFQVTSRSDSRIRLLSFERRAIDSSGVSWGLLPTWPFSQVPIPEEKTFYSDYYPVLLKVCHREEVSFISNGASIPAILNL